MEPFVAFQMDRSIVFLYAADAHLFTKTPIDTGVRVYVLVLLNKTWTHLARIDNISRY